MTVYEDHCPHCGQMVYVVAYYFPYRLPHGEFPPDCRPREANGEPHHCPPKPKEKGSR